MSVLRGYGGMTRILDILFGVRDSNVRGSGRMTHIADKALSGERELVCYDISGNVSKVDLNPNFVSCFDNPCMLNIVTVVPG